MTTFTLRASEALAGRLSSAEMRSWLEDFLRYPHALPADPGSGRGRVSLTLSENAVNAVTEYCQCQVSSVLRRIAVERLGVVQAVLPRSSSGSQGGNPNRSAIAESSSSQPDAPLAFLVLAIFWILIVGSCFFLKSRNSNASPTEE